MTSDPANSGRDLPPLVEVKPAARSILLRSTRPVAIASALAAAFALLRSWFQSGTLSTGTPVDSYAADICGLLAILFILRAGWKLIAEILLWVSRSYTLTGADITASSGFFSKTFASLPVRNIQQIIVDRTLAERSLGLGTILVSSAGSQRIDVAWVNVARPQALAAAIRKALDAAAPAASYLEDTPGAAPVNPIVLGLVGGIGAGKSAVAAALGELGCLIIDSDRDARAALDRPDVRDSLVKWWGTRILGADGKVDRKAVASIVFADPTQRTRLESLVHPIVRANRKDVIARAAAEGRKGVVIDAPLLFEAQSDRECDAVIFVDAPRAQRLERVKSRGWDEAELARREKAQLSLEEKKSRSHAVIVNDADMQTLRARTRAVFEAQCRRHAAGEEPRKVR